MRRPSWLAGFLLFVCLGGFVVAGLTAPAHAKDGGGGGSSGSNSGSGGGNSGSGSSGQGGSGGGGDDDGVGGDDDGGGGGDDGGGDNHGSGGSGGSGNSGSGGGGKGDFDTSGSREARNAVAKGMALSLSKVIPTVKRKFPGNILDVDLRSAGGGRLVYRFLVLSREGSYREVDIDALRNVVVRVRDR